MFDMIVATRRAIDLQHPAEIILARVRTDLDANNHPRSAAAALIHAAPYFPEALRAEAVQLALHEFRSHRYAPDRTPLSFLARAAPLSMQGDVVDYVLGYDGDHRVRATGHVIPHLDPVSIERLLEALPESETPWLWVPTLHYALSRLPPAVAERALSKQWWRIVDQLPELRQVPSAATLDVRRLALEAVVAVVLEDQLTDEPVFDGRRHMGCLAAHLQTTPFPLVLDTLVLLFEGLGSRNRSVAFVILAQLAPALAHLAGPNALRRLANAIDEAQDWWP